LWSNNATTQSITVSTTGNYSVTVTNANNCSATSAATGVTVNALPTATASNNGPVVSGNSLTLTASGGTSYSWSGPNSFTSTLQSPSITTASTLNAGTYTVAVTNAGNCTAIATTNVVVSTVAGAALNFDGTNDYVDVATNTNIPVGNSNYTIEAWIKPNSGGIYAIAGWGKYGTTNQANVFRMQDATHLVSYWWANDLTATVPNMVDGNWHHVATTFDGTTRRIYFDGVLKAQDNPTGHNVPSANNLTIGTANPVTRPVYGEVFNGGLDEVRIWNRALCLSEILNNKNCEIATTANGLVLNYHFNQGISNENNTAITTVIDASGNNNNGTLTNFAKTGTTSNFIAPGGVASGVSCNVFAAPVVSISAGGPTTFCAGGSVVLTASAGSSYTWSTGATTQSITVSTAGNYSVTVVTSGCSGTSPATAVTVNALPTATITAGSATTFCAGGSVILTASAGNSYLWSDNETTQSITVNATGNYSVTVRNANGCSATSAATSVTVNALPTATITAGSATTFCSGGRVILTASAGSSYLWSDNETTQSITVNTAGNYSVTVTNANNCSATSAATSVVVNALPSSKTTQVGTNTFCAGGSTVLTASATGSYLWSNNATTQSITVTASGNYSVTVTDANNCSVTSSPYAIVVNPSPTATITAGGATTFCSGGQVILTASAGSSYLWSNGATTQSITVNATGNYSVTVTNATNCSATSAATSVVVNALPSSKTTQVGANTFCAGGSTVLTASATGSYLWSNSATTQSITVTASGNYSVTVTDANNCSARSAAYAIVVTPSPAATVTADGATTFCAGGSVILTASAGSSYLWSSGETTQSIRVNASGNYSVTVTNANNCAATSAATSVTVNALPTATITAGSATTFCAGGSVVFVG
jgi:hypothetical protein